MALLADVIGRLFELFAGNVEGVVDPSPTLAFGERGSLFEEQGTFVKGDALCLAGLAGPEPGPSVVWLVLGHQAHHVPVEAGRPLHILHHQDDLRKVRTEHPVSISYGRARGQRAGLVAAARQIAGDELQETWNALFGERAVADVLIGEGFLVHTSAHVTGIDAVDAQVRVLGREDVGELFQRGLARPVAAPAFVWLYSGVAGHVDDTRILFQCVPEYLDEREGREGVRPVDLFQHVERVVEHCGLRARAEDARVVDERVQAADLARRLRQGRPVLGVRNVSGDGAHTGTFGQPGAGALQRIFAPGVDDQSPALVGQGARQRQAQATRSAGDERRALW